MRTRLASALLLASTALTAPAWSQTATPAAAPTTAPTGSSFGATQPTDIGKVKAQGEQVTPSGVTRVDIGGGLMILEEQSKNRSTVTRDFIAKISPTANPYQMVELLPGANVISSDAFGLNGGDISIHGFSSSQLGLTIDGAPVNDSGSYSLFPQEYLDGENVGQVSIAQGYSDIDSPHIGASGGVVNIYSRDPSKTAGGYTSFSYGSNHTTREFIRLETGQIGRVRGYASYSHYENDHWRGPGGDKRDHFEGKVVVDVRESSKVTASLLWNDAVNNFYQAPNLANYNAYGYSAPQNNLDRIYNPGGTATNQNTGTNGYYKNRINPFRNLIASVPSTFTLTDNVTLDVTPYVWYGYGSGGGATSLSESRFNFGGNRISQDLNGNGTITDKVNFYSPSITETYRPGVITKLTYQMDNHRLFAGYWYESVIHKQYGDYTRLNADGSPVDPFNDGGQQLIIASGPLAGQKLQKRYTITNTRTNVLFVGDEASLLNDRLILDIGVKQAFVSRHVQNLVPSGPYATFQPYLGLTDSETLPTVGVSYKLDKQQTLFGGASTSFRTPANFSLFDQYSVTSSAANNGFIVHNTQKPERTVYLEAGHRFQGEQLATSVSAFAYHFQSRQLSTSVPDPSGSSSYINQNINAGNTTGYGVDFELGTRRVNDFRLYAAGELASFTFDGDIQASSSKGGRTITDALPTKGKTVPGAPNVLFAVGVDYDNGNLFGNFNVKYTGRQYSSFMNDEQIPGYARANAAIGYRFDDVGPAKRPELRLNLYNIADQTGLTGVSGIQQNAKATTGRLGGTIASSTPTYFVGQGFAAIVTLSSGF